MEKEYSEVTHPLHTKKYTKLYAEKDFQFNAPHSFKVTDATNKDIELATVHFQEGPIKLAGVNGVAGEDLIMMVILRLESFQKSQFACRENALALTKLEEALMWLRRRTTDREQRGVEGTHNV